jgi:uncharacterized delta-60 repeat protein
MKTFFHISIAAVLLFVTFQQDVLTQPKAGNLPQTKSYSAAGRHIGDSPDQFFSRKYLLGQLDPDDLTKEWTDEIQNRFLDQPNYSATGHFARQNSFSDNSRLTGGVQEAWVRNYASGLTASDDAAYTIALDSFGYVYIAGYVTRLPYGVVFFTAKYDAQGNLLWDTFYSGEERYDDAVCALAVDHAGNVYVAGTSRRISSSTDYVTIKYDQAGVEQWIARYDGSANSHDRVVDLAIDEAGNVFVTGISEESISGTNYTTIKYNSAGAKQWARYLPVSVPWWFTYSDLTADKAGNCYFTCRSKGIAEGDDYYTVKYDSSGEEQWAARYSQSDDSRDYISSIAVDATGNVYVTGVSNDSPKGTSTVTIKYSPNGELQWLACYEGTAHGANGPNALAVDNENNVCVAGSVAGTPYGSDYLTIKYNPDGKEEWEARYDVPDNSFDESDQANALCIDDEGNIYVTGKSYSPEWGDDYATIKYDPSGNVQWVARYTAPNPYRGDIAAGIVVDNVGSVYVTGVSNDQITGNDCVTVKYNSTGEEQWVQRYTEKAGRDYAQALAVDDRGNLYVTGKSTGYQTNTDFATVKYSADGVEEWVARYNGTANMADEPKAIAVDDAGNVYVTGNSQDSTYHCQFTTIKYNNAGDQQWLAQHQNVNDCNEDVRALVVDEQGNVYVTGSMFSEASYDDFATIKYNSDGITQWIARYAGPGTGRDCPSALAVDRLGNVYVTGVSPGVGSWNNYTTIKYNSSGKDEWVRRYSGIDGSHNSATALAVDDAGNIFVTGLSDTSEIGRCYTTIKYNPIGEELWTAHLRVQGKSLSLISRLAIDDAGNVYVAGLCEGTDSVFYCYLLARYNSAGQEQWIRRYNSSESEGDYFSALAVDNDSNAYLTGYSLTAGPFVSSATVKYNSSGDKEWEAQYFGPGGSYVFPQVLSVDGLGNVMVAAYSEGDGGVVYTTIKYSQNQVSVKGTKQNLPANYSLSQNYPNPFNPTTRIHYSLPQSDQVSLEIYNSLGQEVAKLVDERKQAGEYDVHWDAANLPSGVYVYRLRAGKFTEVRKMLLLR